MKKEIINIPDMRPTDKPFNHVVKAGETLYLTSQLSCDLRTGNIIPGNISVQTDHALKNIKYLLENSNSSMSNILKVVIYMRDVLQFEDMNKVYRTYFKKGEEPARVTIQAASPLKNVDIEIEVTALTNNIA